MSIAFLEKYDRRSATDILAAAALATGHNIEGEEPQLVKALNSEVRQLLSLIRKQLKIAETDGSDNAQESISRFIAKEIEQTLLSEVDVNELLASAGLAGRLNPSVYIVEQPRAFLDTFLNLSIKKANIEDAVKHPDDYQHILAAKADAANKEIISIFLKRIVSAKRGNDHWLLVQTHRNGLRQIVQSAWRIFPEVIDTLRAAKPIDLLRGFAEVFGVPVKIGQHEGKFIESVPAKKGEKVQMTFFVPDKENFFSSMSQTDTPDPNVIQVGAAYCIDLFKYGTFLASKGLIDRPVASTFQQARRAYTPTTKAESG